MAVVSYILHLLYCIDIGEDGFYGSFRLVTYSMTLFIGLPSSISRRTNLAQYLKGELRSQSLVPIQVEFN